jgi:hypothetical protein
MVDTPAPAPAPPPDPELERLKKELARATAEAQLAEQRTKVLTQSMPASDTKALDASTTVDSATIIESEILAYEMLRHVARRIAAHVAGLVEGKSIVVHNDADVTALAMFGTFRTQLDQLAGAFDAVLPKAAQPAVKAVDFGLAIPAVTMAVKSVIDLVALFRTQRVITGVAITIDDLPFISEVAGALKNCEKPPKVYLPAIYPRPGDSAAISEALDKARERSIAAAGRVDEEGVATMKAAATERMTQLEQIRKGYQDFVTHSDGSAAITALVRGATMDSLLNGGDGAHVLYLKVLKSGGANETKKSLFGSSLKHSGGVVVNYMLFDADGTIMASSTDHAYSGEIEVIKRIE